MKRFFIAFFSVTYIAASTLDNQLNTFVLNGDTSVTQANSWQDTAIVISSCDKYSCLWPGFFHYFYRFFPEVNTTLKSVPIYLLSNTKTWEDERVTMILNPHEKCWGDSMKYGLSKIQQKYILFVLDDYFLKEPTDVNLLTEHFEIMKSMGSPYIQVFPTGGFEKCKPIEAKHLIRRKFDKGGFCKTALQIAFWERQTFYDQLTGKEPIWPFETNPIAEEDTRPYLIATKKMINHWNAVTDGKVDPHQMAFFQKECPSLTCNLPKAYELITNSERLLKYGGVDGNHFFWSNYNISVDILVRAIEQNPSFITLLQLAGMRRELLAKYQEVQNSEDFKKLRFQDPLPLGSVIKSSCEYPLMKKMYQDLFLTLNQTLDWSPLKDGYEYLYTVLSAVEWLIIKDPLISNLICLAKEEDNIFKLYDIESMEDGKYIVDDRYLQHIKKSQLKDLTIASLSVRKSDSKEPVTRILYVFDNTSKKDRSDIPFSWIAPQADAKDLTLLSDLYQKAINAQNYEDFIDASFSFYFTFIQKRPLVRGNGSIGKWILDALYTSRKIERIKTRYFAELEQKCLGTLTVEEFIKKVECSF